MITIRKKTFHYKKAQPNKPIKLSLQELLKAALKAREVVMDRARQLSENDPTHLVNYHGIHGLAGASGNLLGVEFLSFSAGQDPSALIIDRKAKELPMEQVGLSAEGKETVEGSVYFGVLDNHVILSQSAALKAIHLERYINWLLIETGKIDDENYIGLVDFVPPKKAKEFKDVREVQMSGAVGFETVGMAVATQAAQEPVDDVKSIQVRPKGERWQAVKSFLGIASTFRIRCLPRKSSPKKAWKYL